MLDLIHCKKKNMAAHFCWDSLMTFSQLPVLGILCWASLQALQKSALLARISLLCTPSSVAEMQAVPRKFDSYSTTTNTYTTQDSLSSIRELALYYSRGAHEPGYCLDEYLHMLCSSRWVASQKTQYFSTCSISNSKMLSFIQNALCYMQELGKFPYRSFFFIPGMVIRLPLVFISDSTFTELCGPMIISEPCIILPHAGVISNVLNKSKKKLKSVPLPLWLSLLGERTIMDIKLGHVLTIWQSL